MTMLNIKGLDKAAVLCAFYARSRRQGLGHLHYDAPMSLEEARELLASSSEFDYLHGRVMKVELLSDEFSPDLYDRDNGEGAAAEAIRDLKP